MFMFIFLFAISVFFAQGGSYLGLFMWIVIPGFYCGRLVIIPIGMIIKHRKNKRSEFIAEKAWPVVNLNEPRTRNAFMIFGVGSLFFLLLSAVGSYEAFHYTESVEFCGTRLS